MLSATITDALMPARPIRASATSARATTSRIECLTSQRGSFSAMTNLLSNCGRRIVRHVGFGPNTSFEVWNATNAPGRCIGYRQHGN